MFILSQVTLLCVCNINDCFPLIFFTELFSLSNVFVGNHGFLSGIDIVPFSINDPLKLC